MTKSLKTLRMTTLIERVLRARPEQGGGSNKYTFRKVSQIVFSQGFASAKCMYFASFRKYAFAIILRFRKLSQVWFRRLSQAFAQIRKYGFAVFRKLSQFMVSQAFARIRKDSQMDFRNHSPRIRKCENHGFSQGFAMGTLLMVQGHDYHNDFLWPLTAHALKIQ